MSCREQQRIFFQVCDRNLVACHPCAVVVAAVRRGNSRVNDVVVSVCVIYVNGTAMFSLPLSLVRSFPVDSNRISRLQRKHAHRHMPPLGKIGIHE